MLQNISISQIKHDTNLSNSFLYVELKKLNLSCNIYNGEFCLDSFNFYLINKNNNTFSNLFTRDLFQKNEHFFTKHFFENFKKNYDNFKKKDNVFVLGSNAGNNYYSNLLQFLPRIFFLKGNNIKIAINRNSSSKFRDFIKGILVSQKIDFTFTYLDDGFYRFTNSQMPQFFDLAKSVNILRSILIPKKSEIKHKKIYVSREGSSYRKVINEADIIPILRSKGYTVIKPELYKIDDQIKIFNNADKIIAPYGSNLANIIFCKPKTDVCVIGPSFNKDFEKPFDQRYEYLANLNDLKYSSIKADTVPIENYSEISKKYINKTILHNSNYYANLIVKVSDIKSLN